MITARPGAAAGLAVGWLADRWLGDPARLHPVAGFGAVAARVEKWLYADSRLRGVAHAALLVGGVAALGILLDRGTPQPMARCAATAATTWVVLGGRSLEREATEVAHLLTVGDLPGARERVSGLVGRHTATLDADGIIRAVVESVAENTSDAVVAPLLWGALAGIPGLLGYRAVNTLDAMVGHRTPRHTAYGWASARLDDVVNLPAARFTGLLVLLVAPRQARATAQAWARDAAGHPSPNAGVVEAAFAGALGIRLGGTNHYPGGRTEHRAVLGDGRAPTAADISRATRLSRRVGAAAALTTTALAMSLRRA